MCPDDAAVKKLKQTKEACTVCNYVTRNASDRVFRSHAVRAGAHTLQVTPS